MTVKELNQEEKLQLKEALVYGADNQPLITKEQQKIIDKAFSSDDISDELVEDIYADINFVKEDFFCNIGKEK
jgi:U3 small nucleolar RNA-associated protein 14